MESPRVLPPHAWLSFSTHSAPHVLLIPPLSRSSAAPGVFFPGINWDLQCLKHLLGHGRRNCARQSSGLGADFFSADESRVIFSSLSCREWRFPPRAAPNPYLPEENPIFRLGQLLIISPGSGLTSKPSLEPVPAPPFPPRVISQPVGQKLGPSKSGLFRETPTGPRSRHVGTSRGWLISPN